MVASIIPSFSDIQDSARLIAPYINKTPVLQSDLLNKLLQCQIYFKCENFQKVGAFKYRGATNAVLRLSALELSKGVTTHSSGNHAGALAKAAQVNGAKAYIVMPNNAPKVKIMAVKTYGGKITFCEPTLQAREETLQKVQQETGAYFIHPYDNFQVISGQGTACLELFDQLDEPDIIIAPVGGGGLLSGTAIVAKNQWKNTLVYGAEPRNADDAYQSFNQKVLIPSKNPKTIADGLKTSLSERTFSIITTYVDDIFLVKEHTIMEALRLVFQYLKIVIEPSSAVALAVLMENVHFFKGKKVVLIMSGGNADLANLPF